MEIIALLMFLAIVIVLLCGYPVAFTLGGVALIFALAGAVFGGFDTAFLDALPSRVFGIMNNETLVAVPLFVFMGVVLERSRLAEQLLDTMGQLLGGLRGGLGLAVLMVGTLLAASTGIVGATVVTMGLLSLPTMLKRGYAASLSAGTICAAGTLGQIIPPSIVLVLLGDVLSSAYQQAQLQQGIYAPQTVSVGELFIGALLPGLFLVALYAVYILTLAVFRPAVCPALPADVRVRGRALVLRVTKAMIPPLALMMAVLGSIIAGFATPTEAAAVGAIGALLLALLYRQLSLAVLREAIQSTVRITSMVFMILVGAALFSLVFRGYGGDTLVHELLHNLPGGAFGAMLVVMLLMFLLGFVLDFIEITFVVVPIVGPALLAMGLDPVWLGIMIAMNLQTSFLTPPFGFALFYLRGVAPAGVTTTQIYRGAVPFVVIQALMLAVLAVWPELATWLPARIFAQ